MVIKRKDLVYKELGFKLVGLAFDVFNDLGYGHKEVVYENAYEEALKRERLSYQRQLYVPVKFKRIVNLY